MFPKRHALSFIFYRSAKQSEMLLAPYLNARFRLAKPAEPASLYHIRRRASIADEPLSRFAAEPNHAAE